MVDENEQAPQTRGSRPECPPNRIMRNYQEVDPATGRYLEPNPLQALGYAILDAAAADGRRLAAWWRKQANNAARAWARFWAVLDGHADWTLCSNPACTVMLSHGGFCLAHQPVQFTVGVATKADHYDRLYQNLLTTVEGVTKEGPVVIEMDAGSLAPPKLWIVGSFQHGDEPGTRWQFHGLHYGEGDAVAACTSPGMFVAPIHQRSEPRMMGSDWPGLYYPGRDFLYVRKEEGFSGTVTGDGSGVALPELTEAKTWKLSGTDTRRSPGRRLTDRPGRREVGPDLSPSRIRGYKAERIVVDDVTLPRVEPGEVAQSLGAEAVPGQAQGGVFRKPMATSSKEGQEVFGVSPIQAIRDHLARVGADGPIRTASFIPEIRMNEGLPVDELRIEFPDCHTVRITNIGPGVPITKAALDQDAEDQARRWQKTAGRAGVDLSGGRWSEPSDFERGFQAGVHVERLEVFRDNPALVDAFNGDLSALDLQPGLVEYAPPLRLWLVGQHKEGQPWEYQGLHWSEADAVKACQARHWFIAPVRIGEPVPVHTQAFPGAYYPLIEARPGN